MRKNAGFTLVELLVVITIIAILSAVGFTSYAAFVKNARDARRQSDLKFIQSALEQYFADQKFYPQAASGSCPSTGDGLLRNKCSLTNLDGTKIYITQVPSDPQSSPDYSYVPLLTGTNYCLFAKLEGTSPQSDSGCTPTSSYTYGVTKP